ncbi:MAG: right-handed parallel beta-helix repeat-containing protein [Saprospiraceae bacterium]|nr:right-handed parallel beta-helix repeat-containing protein [Saprospiraceae bacterium]
MLLPIVLLFYFFTLSAQEEELPPCGCTEGAAQIGSGVGVPTLQSAISLGLIVSAANSPSTPQQVCVKGTLTAQNINYTFFLSVVTMDANAEIKVNTNGTLTFDNSTVQGCTTMWNHIEVSGSGKLNSFSSTIQDGKQAFRIRTGARLKIKGNQFINDYVGIFLINATPNTLGKVHLDDVFTGNNFSTSQSGLKSPYAGQLGFAGIQNTGMAGLTVGTTNGAGSPNTFTNLLNGVVAYNASLAVNGASFTRIKQQANSSGIRLDGLCAGVFAKNSFTDCNFGLNSVTAFSINFSDNTLTDIHDRGVYIQGFIDGVTPKGNIVVNSNNISTLSSGVQTAGIHVTGVNTLNAASNIVTVGNATGLLEEYAGIYLENSYFSSALPGFVSGNTINAYSGANGIHWGSGANSITENNTITLFEPASGSPSSFGFATGIIQGCNDNAITTGNTVLGYGTSNNLTDGISTVFGNNMTFCCNGTNLTKKGFNYFGTGTLWRISQTSFGTHEVGLFVQGNSSFTVQENQGNQWLGTYSVAGAQHTGSDPSAIFNSRFRVNPFASPFKPLVVSTPNAPGASWFTPGSGSPMTCAQFPECGIPIIGEDSPIDSFDIIIAQGLFATGTPQEPVMRWVAERGLYARLQANNSLLSLNPSLTSFYNANQTTKVGLYQTVENAIAALSGLSPVERAQFKANSDLILSHLNQLVQKDYQMVDASAAQLSALALDKENLTNSIYQLELANEVLYATIQGALYAQIPIVQAQNAALVASNIWEQNEKTVNEIYLSWLLTNDLTTAQLAQLLAIASQCPLEGGRSVFVTRGLYSLKVRSNFEDGILCAGAENREDGTVIAATIPEAGF